jgi:hypothetical protein
MKIYKTEAELIKDVVNGSLIIEDSITLEFNMSIRINITAWNITAENINAGDINAWNINAGDILYYAFCCVYNSILCLSIKAKREKHQKPICLDGKLKLKKATQ